jgi:hypothetical protein
LVVTGLASDGRSRPRHAARLVTRADIERHRRTPLRSLLPARRNVAHGASPHVVATPASPSVAGDAGVAPTDPPRYGTPGEVRMRVRDVTRPSTPGALVGQHVQPSSLSEAKDLAGRSGRARCAERPSDVDARSFAALKDDDGAGGAGLGTEMWTAGSPRESSALRPRRTGRGGTASSASLPYPRSACAIVTIRARVPGLRSETRLSSPVAPRVQSVTYGASPARATGSVLASLRTGPSSQIRSRHLPSHFQSAVSARFISA